MARRGRAGSPRTEPIEVDVLIMGGGIMGLWLLNDLRQHDYAALLLERRELGGEQTCHSHAYIHQGHLYRDIELAGRLKDVNARWQDWLGQHPLRREAACSYFGFRNPADAREKINLWEHPDLGLRYEMVAPDALPVALRGGTIEVVLQTPEICLNGESLVRALSQDVDPFISRIAEVEDIRVNPDADSVEEVTVAMPQGEHLTFRPKGLVLAAGAGNQALLDGMSSGHRPLLGRVRNAQQIRKAHMLVVKGKKNDLDPLTGIFPPYGGLFLVSRNFGDETVWLVSDDRSPEVSFVEDWTVYDARWWLPRVWAALQDVAPRSFKHPELLRWGIYDAPKAEGRALGVTPSNEYIEQFRFRNLWAIWPTKLTLAPKASRTVISQIRQLIPQPSPWASAPLEWNMCRVPAEVAPERWTKTPLMSWDEFRRVYNLQ